MDGLFYTMNNQLIYTVTQINNYSSDILKNKLSNVWVAGEISSLKKYPSGYTYITLKDSKSELSCVCNYQLTSDIVEGMEVTVNGSADIYTFKGNYQFRITNIFLKRQGDLWLKYSKLKEKLSKEGLFDDKYKKQIPNYSENIGIITSLEGSVLSDIRNIINRRSPYVNLFLIDSKVKFKKNLILEYAIKRKSTQPVNQWSSGCIFKNPNSKCSASYLIEKSGLKSTRVGGIYVSKKHSNYFINDGNGTCHDLEKLISFVKNRIKKEHNINLDCEIHIFGSKS